MNLRVCFLALAASLANAAAAAAQTPSFDHVFVIVMENQEYDSVVGSPAAPYINSLAQQYGLATNAFGVTHPSLPNYMAMTGGDTFFTDDCVGCVADAPNIADRMEAAGRSWTAYMEDMPSACLATDSGLYVAKHNPFVHYMDIVSNAARCTSHVVPFSRFSTDLSSGSLAQFVWITPNLCNDMHDCSVATGDAWLSTVVPKILQSPAFKNSVLFLTWDEGVTAAGGGGHIPLIVASPYTPAGLRVSTPVNHYSLLRTIEDAWNLAPLAQSANATAMSQFFPQSTGPASEQVIYAADVTTISGTWQKVADATAAAGVKLSTPDNNAPTVDAPQANPVNFFDATFSAAPGTRYRVWLRIHATNDSKWNDSVFVQFSDSVDAAGNAVYRIGTTGGYTVNLWPCSTCQSFGWGWQRNAYWLPDSGDVWFPTGGSHRIRVQVREDGVEIDQIVISPSQFLNSAPGAISNDTTIVPKPGGGPPPPPGPPPPWTSQDVGATGLAGSASYSTGTFTVKGAGADIWGAADGFFYVSQSVSGDVQIVARVASIENTNTYAKAGVMLRASTAADAAHVILDVRPAGGVEFMTRTAAGAQTTFVAGDAQPAPAWLKLSRTGTSVSGYVSSDGTSWRLVGSTSSTIGSAALVGLVVTSHNTAALNTSTFDSVSVAAASGQQLPAPWTDEDVGATGLAGSASYASGTFTVTGAGADIWGGADAFHFVDQPIAGDMQIVARVAGLQNTNTFAKAGVMLRASTAPGSAHVILDVRPAGGIEFMTRSADGAQTTFIAGDAQPAPVWLKLVRTGSTVAGSVSADGVSWRTVGSIVSTIGSNALIGLAVTSHDTSVRNTSTFDNVSVVP
jgi:regulation of enolase protein 1 (concanavalin A-like superfamily)